MPIDRPNDAHHGLNRREALATSAASNGSIRDRNRWRHFFDLNGRLGAGRPGATWRTAPSGVEALHQ